MPTLKTVQNLGTATDILQRLVSAAILAEIPNPEAWVIANKNLLIVAQVNEGGTDTLASVYEYQVAQIEAAKGVVTDAHLIFAVNKVQEDLEAE